MRELERYRTNPLQRGYAYLLEAGMHADAGRNDDALAVLERALADGCRYRREWLEHANALANVRGLPRFREIVATADARYNDAAAAARPHLTLAVPDEDPDAFGYPLLVALHGNNSNARATAPLWSTMADAGWVVAVPQSSEIGPSPDAYTWNDRERTAAEIAAHIERVKQVSQIDVGRIVLGGFSMGGTQALALPLARKLRVRGVVAVAAWLPTVDELRTLVEAGAGRMLRTYLVVGDQDPSYGGTRALAELFASRGMRAELDVRAGLGHEYPADMTETLKRALAYLTAPS